MYPVCLFFVFVFYAPLFYSVSCIFIKITATKIWVPHPQFLKKQPQHKTKTTATTTKWRKKKVKLHGKQRQQHLNVYVYTCEPTVFFVNDRWTLLHRHTRMILSRKWSMPFADSSVNVLNNFDTEDPHAPFVMRLIVDWGRLLLFTAGNNDGTTKQKQQQVGLCLYWYECLLVVQLARAICVPLCVCIWRCGRARFCVEVFVRHISMFIHLFKRVYS